MISKAKWIGVAAGELGMSAARKLTAEQKEEQKKRALGGEDPTRRGSILFRKDFYVSSPFSAAELSIAGLGFCRVSVNGVCPDENRVFSPLVSDYERRIKYDVYDVAALVKEGKNCVCVELGPGWYTGNPKYWGWQQTWYGNPRLIALLTVDYGNGESVCAATDVSWKTAPGNVTVSCVYDGEAQDLSIAPENWDAPDFSADGWRNAVEVEAPGGVLTECKAPPVRITRVLPPVSEKRLSPTEVLFDFGENLAAVPRVTVQGRKGDSAVFHHAEFLKDDGTLDPRSENRALCTDKFVLSDGNPVTLSPKFTWHGYRYMTVTLSSDKMRIIKAESCAVHSDVPVTGSFECSDEKLNELHRAYVRTLLSCLQGVPVDCPQRDERKAWLGDAYAASEACLYNFDMSDLYGDWLEDLRICSHPEHGYIPFICPTFGDDDTSVDWNLAYPAILAECCERYGGMSLPERHYETLKKHTQYYIDLSDNGMIPPCWFGDWCTPDIPEGQEKVAFRPGEEDHRQNPPFAATLFYAQTLRLAAGIAEFTGHMDDALIFRMRREEARQALIKKYFDPATGRFGSGGQFLQTMLLAEDLVDEKDRPAAVGALLREIESRDYHPYVGIIGLRRIYDLLCGLGRPDIAWRMLTVKGYPGQLNMLSGGRTTLTECLDFSGSGNHCMFASPDAFLYKRLGGIVIDRTRIIPVEIKPFCPDELDHVRCSQTLPEGEVFSGWRRENSKIEFEIRVPEGISARIELRTGTDSYDELLENGGKIKIVLKN